MKTVFQNARIVDGTGNPAIENGVLIVENNRIAYAGTAQGVDPVGADKIVDMQGYTLLPGLFNIHCHLDLGDKGNKHYDGFGTAGYRALVSYRRAVEALECGITTVRHTGMPDGVDFAVRKAIDKGMLWGARIIACGAPLVALGGHGGDGWGVAAVAGVNDCIRAVREQCAQNADFIKMIATGGMSGSHEKPADQQMTDEEMATVIKVAHGNGRRCTVHIGGDHAIRVCLEHGIDSLEHAYTMSYEVAKMVADAGVYLTPTFIISQGYDVFAERGASEHMLSRVKEFELSHREVVGNAVKAGVPLCIGTDWLPSDPMRGSNATVVEMECLVDVLGISPLEVIKAGTRNSADNCGILPITGTLEIGKEADIIATEGKPDIDIHDLRKLCMVMKGGAVAWSTVDGFVQRNLSVATPGQAQQGGALIDWMR
jgi:imidazolonepropionase-like amidohydrolase